LWESSKTSETRNREFNELSVLDCHGSSSWWFTKQGTDKTYEMLQMRGLFWQTTVSLTSLASTKMAESSYYEHQMDVLREMKSRMQRSRNNYSRFGINLHWKLKFWFLSRSSRFIQVTNPSQMLHSLNISEQ
jgi:hypothetical protein